MTEGETFKVHGWFDWEDYNLAVVESAPPGSTLVEIGVFCGLSLIDLAQRAQAANKGLKVVGIDTFQGSPEFYTGAIRLADGQMFTRDHAGNLAAHAMSNLARAKVLDDVTLIVSDSSKAARFFENASVWSVFLDGDHSEVGVSADIAAWMPKLTDYAWMGGHDYADNRFGVGRVVDRLFPNREAMGNTWRIRVKL